MNQTQSRVLRILLKELAIKPTITFLAKEIGLSRVGIWKLIKKMQSEKMIVLIKISSGKTSAYSISLNWDNPLLVKNLEVVLTEDAIKHQRWLNNFAGLEKKVDFLMLYGSIINSPKEANDIDILGVTPSKNNLLEIEKTIKNIQKTQIRKIHILNFTPAEFKEELEKPNKAFIDAIKKGIILFGRERFVKFLRGMPKK